MSDVTLNNATTTGMNTSVSDFSVASKSLDETNAAGNTYYYNKDFKKYLGYYKTIPELKKAIDALVMWSFGLGYNASELDKTILEHIQGNGKETFDQLIWNFAVTGIFNGESYMEIIKEDDTLINLKVLNPENVRVEYDKKGLIVNFGVWNGDEWKNIKPENILHYQHEKVGSEIHGTSVIEACKWVIDARNEAMSDKRRAMHRSLIRVLEVDADDTTTLNTLKTQWADAVKNGEVLILPKDNVKQSDIAPMSTQEHSDWIRYLETFYYKAVGVPEIIMGGSQEYSEASSKVGHLTFEQPHKTMRRRMEQLIWNQLQIKIEFDEPESLKDNVAASEAANTGQMGFQANEAAVGMGRTE